MQQVIIINEIEIPVVRKTKTCLVVNPNGRREIFFGDVFLKQVAENKFTPTSPTWYKTYTPSQLRELNFKA